MTMTTSILLLKLNVDPLDDKSDDNFRATKLFGSSSNGIKYVASAVGYQVPNRLSGSVLVNVTPLSGNLYVFFFVGCDYGSIFFYIFKAISPYTSTINKYILRNIYTISQYFIYFIPFIRGKFNI